MIRKRRTLNEFIEDSIIIHGDKYIYPTNLNKVNSTIKVPIECKLHGFWNVNFDNHINKKSGCPKCAGFGLTLEERIQKANLIHSNKYNYSLIDKFIGTMKNYNIVCSKHGIFKQSWDNHTIKKNGCPKCSSFNLDFNDRIIEANKIHNNKYDYSLITKDFKTENKVPIICKDHGVFYQKFTNHAKLKQGCPICNIKSKGEEIIYNLLNIKELNFTREYKFNNCVNYKTNRKLPFDFYLPDYNICIEFDGEFHYKSVKYFGGDEGLKDIQFRDNIKTEYCKNNNIKLIRISYLDIDEIDCILNNELK